MAKIAEGTESLNTGGIYLCLGADEDYFHFRDENA